MQNTSSSQEPHPNYGSIAVTGTGIRGSELGQGPSSAAPTQGTWKSASPRHNNSNVDRQAAGTHPSSSHHHTPSQTSLSRSRRASDAQSVSSQASRSSTSSWFSGSTDSLDDIDEEGDEESALDTPAKGRRLFWSYIALAPILVLVIVAFATLLQILVSDNGHGHDSPIIHFDLFGIGMVGWGISFALRRPVFAIVSRGLHLDFLQCEWVTLLAAGVLDETVRLILISSAILGQSYNNTNSNISSGSESDGDDFGKVYWLGLGWASIETMYYLGQSLIFSRWLTKEEAKDPEARQEVRQMLGIDLERTSPLWSIMGRTSSLMVHLGLSCWLGVLGLKALIPAMIVHGSLNLVWGVLMPHKNWSVPATSYGTFMTSLSVFFLGLALYGEIV